VIKQDILESLVNTSYLAIGSNVGNRKNYINKAKYYLNKLPIIIIKTSKIYETPSWPNNKDPKFYNIVVKIKTNLKLNNLFIQIKKIEKKLGRKFKAKKNSPRTCDIDIIDFNGKASKLEINKNKLIVPHPRMIKRNFVLIPLFEIDKNWKHPQKKTKIIDLIDKLEGISFRSIKLI
tara:strand:+ start:777 stop:1307 length:531 start_codon:yes stop_codon:yes gene_type:complete